MISHPKHDNKQKMKDWCRESGINQDNVQSSLQITPLHLISII